MVDGDGRVVPEKAVGLRLACACCEFGMCSSSNGIACYTFSQSASVSELA
jgi:hypothetical protein